jgi:hypothetical protein
LLARSFSGKRFFIITLAGSLIFEQALLIIFDPLNEKRGNIETSDFNKYQSRNVKFRNPNVKIQPQVGVFFLTMRMSRRMLRLLKASSNKKPVMSL